MRTRQCCQAKCCFYNDEGCPVCRECRSKSNIVDDYCIACYLCEKEEGELRGNPNIKKKVDELMIIKM